MAPKERSIGELRLFIIFKWLPNPYSSTVAGKAGKYDRYTKKGRIA